MTASDPPSRRLSASGRQVDRSFVIISADAPPSELGPASRRTGTGGRRAHQSAPRLSQPPQQRCRSSERHPSFPPAGQQPEVRTEEPPTPTAAPRRTRAQRIVPASAELARQTTQRALWVAGVAGNARQRRVPPRRVRQQRAPLRQAGSPLQRHSPPRLRKELPTRRQARTPKAPSAPRGHTTQVAWIPGKRAQ